MTPATDPRTLDVTAPQKVSYCIETWLRDEQIRVNTALVRDRLVPTFDLRDDPVAVVCYGPSLNETWPEIRRFKYIVSCSGAHKFLIERGIVPTWHVDVDPRPHKITLIGAPHRDVEYLLAATCHPDYFRLLVNGGFTVKLWHVFDGAPDALRLLPPGEVALTGGCSVGLRALTVARILGFRDQHIFGMDGSEGTSGKHAAAHPNQAPKSFPAPYGGRVYMTTPGFLEAARQTAHELDDLKDVDPTFYGDGLVQAMMKDYQRQPRAASAPIAFSKPELITSEYRRQNELLHQQNLTYGVAGGRHVDTVLKLLPTLKRQDLAPPAVLDYGCGKGYLGKKLSFPIFEYDPAIPGKTESPRPADLVCCFDVLEHVEPACLTFVLGDLQRCVKQIGYFVIHTGPAIKTLPDGRNTHLIQQGREFWDKKLARFFTVVKMFDKGKELHVLVAPRAAPAPLLNFDSLAFEREPYLIGCATDVMDEQTYSALAAEFPPVALFKAFAGDRKMSLSSVNNTLEYERFINGSPVWKPFHKYIRKQLVEQLRPLLLARGVNVLELHRDVKARWEFSILPGDGGGLRPHTDIPSKLVTLVIGMQPRDEPWDAAWGGGTGVLVPKDGTRPLDDYKAPWEEFDVVRSYAYVPNRCVVFIKSDRSWHGVRPLTGPAIALRRTLTINIEKVA